MSECGNNLMCEIIKPNKLKNLKKWVNQIPNNVYLRLDIAKIIQKTIESIKEKTKMNPVTKFVVNNMIIDTETFINKLNKINLDTTKFQPGPGKYFPLLGFNNNEEPVYSETETQAEYLSEPTNLYKVLSLMDEIIGTVSNPSMIGNLINIKGKITNYYHFIACEGIRGGLTDCII